MIFFSAFVFIAWYRDLVKQCWWCLKNSWISVRIPEFDPNPGCYWIYLRLPTQGKSNLRKKKKNIICVLQSSVLDFGKIIICTSNLRIIRASARTSEGPRRRPVSPTDLWGSTEAKERGSGRKSRSKDGGESQLGDTEVMTLVVFSSTGAVETHCLKLITSARLQDGECGHIVVICNSSQRSSYFFPSIFSAASVFPAVTTPTLSPRCYLSPVNTYWWVHSFPLPLEQLAASCQPGRISSSLLPFHRSLSSSADYCSLPLTPTILFLPSSLFSHFLCCCWGKFILTFPHCSSSGLWLVFTFFHFDIWNLSSFKQLHVTMSHFACKRCALFYHNVVNWVGILLF